MPTEGHQGGHIHPVHALAATAIEEALRGVEVLHYGGVSVAGEAYLTPRSVRRTLIKSGLRRSPLGFTDKAEFDVNHASGATLLYSCNQGIFLTGLRFPEVCCVCLDAPSCFKLFEAGVREGSISLAKVSFQGVTLEQVDRIAEAVEQKRYWCPIPFCSSHVSDDAVHVESSAVEFRSKDYARAFAMLNSCEGRWLTRPALALRSGFRWLGLAWMIVTVILAASADFRSIAAAWPAIASFSVGFLLMMLGFYGAIGRPIR